MRSLYVSQQGCYVTLHQEQLVVACLWRDIPIVYLLRMGYCYGRTLAIEWEYRALAWYQQELDLGTVRSRAKYFRGGDCVNFRGSWKMAETLIFRREPRLLVLSGFEVG